MSTSTTAPPTSHTATKTAYHILKRLEPLDPATDTPASKTTYVLVYEALEAASGDAAIRYFATGKPDGNHTKAIEGSYVAIPSRSFVEKTVKVETTTTVKLS